MIYDSCFFMCCMTQVESDKNTKAAATSQLLMIHDSCFHVPVSCMGSILFKGGVIFFWF